jgi:hypothetical protein
MATMIRTRRAMPPIMSPREREAPVHGSLILSSVSGLVLCHACLRAMELSLLVMPPESARLLRLSPRVLDVSTGKQVLCQTLLLSLLQHTGICPRERSGGRAKDLGSSRARQEVTRPISE